MGNALVAVDLLIGLLDRATVISDLIRKAQSEGRDITAAELDQLAKEDDTARAALQAAIDKAKQQPQ